MTTTIRAALVANAQLSKGEVAFKITDQKGRTTGYRWTISALTYQELPEGPAAVGRSYWTLPADAKLNRIRVWGTPTRDGVNYGPAFNWTDVDTFEEATLLVAKRIAAAQKRDAKKFAA